MSFQECDLENLIIDAIKGKGYTYAHGDTLRREYDNVLLEDDLTAFLKKKYAGNGITNSEITHIIMSLKSVSSTPVYDANKTVYKKIVDG